MGELLLLLIGGYFLWFVVCVLIELINYLING
jgi:hypothetical protein